jgi:hypothetical protein
VYAGSLPIRSNIPTLSRTCKWLRTRLQLVY